MQKIRTSLWFDDEAEEAANFYIWVFEGRPGASPGSSKTLEVLRYGEAGPRKAGTVMTVAFQLEGQEFMALNGGPDHTFTEAVSLFVNCESQEEVDELWSKLSEGGEEGPCGWLKDRFGLSWHRPNRAHRAAGRPRSCEGAGRDAGDAPDGQDRHPGAAASVRGCKEADG